MDQSRKQKQQQQQQSNNRRLDFDKRFSRNKCGQTNKEQVVRDAQQPEDTVEGIMNDHGAASRFNVHLSQKQQKNLHNSKLSISASVTRNSAHFSKSSVPYEAPHGKNISINSGAMWKTGKQINEQVPEYGRLSRSPIRRSLSRRVNPIIQKFNHRRKKE
jgi:hypothetical protein